MAAGYLGTWSKLPVALQGDALAEIERRGLYAVMFEPDDVALINSPVLADLPDAIDYTQSCARSVAELRGACHEATPPPGATHVRIAAPPTTQ